MCASKSKIAAVFHQQNVTIIKMLRSALRASAKTLKKIVLLEKQKVKKKE